MVQHLYVLAVIFNMVRTFASRKYTHNFVTKLYSYNLCCHGMWNAAFKAEYASEVHIELVVLAAMVVEISVFWDTMLCSLMKVS